MVRPSMAEDNFAGDPKKRDGWYLLRRGVSFDRQHYPAGAIIERVHGDWCVHEGAFGAKRALELEPWMVCDVSYDGVSLFVVECDAKNVLSARAVLSSSEGERVDPLLVSVTLQPGESCVCARFGRCFLPLEFFGW